MKATVQYNDLKGSVAVDIADEYSCSLQNYLESNFKSYDGSRFAFKGLKLFIGDHGTPSITFYCVDCKTSQLHSFITKDFYKFQQAFGLFKRFEVILGDVESDSEPEDETLLDEE
jgi:hypothetical protein